MANLFRFGNAGRDSEQNSRELTSNSASESYISFTRDGSSPDFSVSFNLGTSPNCFQPLHTDRACVASVNMNMQVKGSTSETIRVSVSSAPSTSSHGSAPDDCDALGDVYIWGEVISDNVKVGDEKDGNYLSKRVDVLVPKPLESYVVLDVHRIACGVKHAALVTRQGEIFTWGEEASGRLGHGVGKDAIQPRLVESLAVTHVNFVACGEFHTCAVTMSGELYTWGDGTHNTGLLGHGTNVSHWIPKRISGPLEGLQVASVTCGPWHTALVTSTGQLFTFGDGTFGVLGHGGRESVGYPREVESLSGLRTIAVACGVWHTAAVVEVIVSQSSSRTSSGKLFTWGDGDKNRLGHGDKEPCLKPTCVLALIDYNFHKIACGHSLTVGLTTAGHVFAMGSTVYGQLGNPQSDGKLPYLVEDKLSGESVEEIACGAYHVAVLTSKNEVYTWGKGANGRLGHGDTEDRKTPTLVESLKDRHVKYISCGANYTTAICLHKWVPGVEQSQCSSCRQAFGFTRKRHNCYNCGLVHCHSCSSRKATRAALAPSPGKPYRVCDSCFVKLNKVSEASNHNRKNSITRLSGENKDRLDKVETTLLKSSLATNVDLIKQLDNKAAKQGRRVEAFSLIRTSQSPSLLQLKDVASSRPVDLWSKLPKPVLTSSRVSSTSVSPFSRRPSPPRSATPVPTTSGLSFSKSISDSLKKTNDLLNQEVLKLRSQVEGLRQRCEFQEVELKKSAKKVQEALAMAAEESAKAKAAKDVIKSLTAQLKDMAERLPSGVYDTESMKPTYLPNGLEPNVSHYSVANGVTHSRSDPTCGTSFVFPARVQGTEINGNQVPTRSFWNQPQTNRRDDHSDARLSNGSPGIQASCIMGVDGKESMPLQDGENGAKAGDSTLVANGSQVEAEWIEQYEPGVYITLVALRDGTRELKRVRFSRRRFGEYQAETWWSENREKVHERYNVSGSDKSSVSGQAARRSEGAMSSISNPG